MKKLPYHHVDVFTQQRFGGNQLAVFLDPPPDISTELMQSIARAMNFSESTFVFAPRDDRSDFHVRIFTPGKELPMAGHPTVGTAFVLQHAGRIPAQGTVRFEEGVGIIPVALTGDGSGVAATMQQPAPQFGGIVNDLEALARGLSLEPSQIRSDVPAEIISCGVSFIYVPLKNLDAGIKGLRIGVPKSYFYDSVSPDMAARVRDSLDVFRRAGASLVEVPIPDIAAANPLTTLVTAAEGAAVNIHRLKTRAGDFGPQTLGRLVLGLLASPDAITNALRWRKTIVREFCETVFSACDMLHTPVMVESPPTIAESDIGANPGFSKTMVAMGHCTRPFNFMGLPAISVPCGFDAKGLPSAFQLAARPFAENTLLRAANAYERETDWVRRCPSG